MPHPHLHQAEGQGFEPWNGFYPVNCLAGSCLKPARPPLRTALPKDILRDFPGESQAISLAGVSPAKGSVEPPPGQPPTTAGRRG